MLEYNALHEILKEAVYGAGLYVCGRLTKNPFSLVMVLAEENHSTLFFHNTIICSCLVA